ncbi:fructose-specific PTS transporter subunit EIIC [Reinekea marinisedimentorum]|uniref:protein-N(pi)-phosphohistidine--D-fructose phosphotransferase n=1 Tax=Reinekea marinisedimentorum TaxID=230495 RepID=A0A4R3HSF7_9GAMM|nr:fructose-specific PTS transporter subunit EIIC [Reinekea marinisedimentorum]TCS35878.1 PTS system fructose-specific IIC component [Reinekea marinisedimentorum]
MQPLNIIAVTACPTGVAHTFMAAEALQIAATEKGHQIKVETRGSIGAGEKLTAEEIAAADFVILAVDIEVDTSAFAGKRIYRTSTGNALRKAAEVIETAATEAVVEQGSAGNQPAADFKKEKTGAYKHLMTGVSFMLPVVVAGGLIIALSFIFGIEAFKEEGTLAAALMTIGGGSAFALMIPVLAGYIAFSIADRPGLAPGLVGGMLASSVGAGFLGGIVAGFIAGYGAKWLVDTIKLPKSLESLKPILIVPFIATLVTGLIMIYIVGGPVSAIMNGLTDFLQSMGSANAVVLGIILGAMMCFDLGGPVNKAAYTFGVGLLASQTYAPMAAVMAAGMTPAIGMGLATFFGRKYFTDSEHEAGRASFVLGLCFISEGAIPFAAKDPLRVIPSTMIGGAITGALSMVIGAELLAPHGGIFVLFIPNAISHVFLYAGSIAIGSVVTAACYLVAKNIGNKGVTQAA